MKKILIITMLLLGIIFISSSALADCETGGYKVDRIIMEDEQERGGVSLFAQPSVPFEEYIYNKILRRDFDSVRYDIIDISAYSLSLDEAFARLEKVSLANPELMIYTSQYGYDTDKNGFVTVIAPNYIYDSMYISAVEWNKMDKWIQDFVDSVDKNLSDEEKLLKVYYFVAENVEYSYGDMLENSDPLIFTAYNAYKNGHCVCQGYVTLMCEILERLDIKCGVVPSTTINHIWNYVELDGKNYHFDITWDDIDTNGVVRYWDFLLSDSARIARIAADTGIPQTGRNWNFLDEDIICNSTKYESGYIWNWLGVIKDIEECDRGWRGKCLFRLSESEYDTAPFVFAGIKIPDDEIIMSEITPSGRLFYDILLQQKKSTDLYIAEYDENNRLTRVTSPYSAYLQKSGLWYLPLVKPNAPKINVMWLDSKTLAPLGRNVIME